MNRVLEEIVGRTRADLERDPIDRNAVERKARRVVDRTHPHRFRDQLARPGVRIIAEIKAASPSAGAIMNDPPVAAIAREYADGGAAALSVVTEPHFFRGRREWLGEAGGVSGLPVIMKDFVVEPAQVIRGIAAGADAILLLASILTANEIRELLAVCGDFGRDALVEVHDEAELERAIESGAGLIGVNNRNLQTFEVSLETSERLGSLIPSESVRVSESGVRSADDVRRLQAAGFKAFLVGETLMRSDDRAGMLRSLCQVSEVNA